MLSQTANRLICLLSMVPFRHWRSVSCWNLLTWL